MDTSFDFGLSELGKSGVLSEKAVMTRPETVRYGDDLLQEVLEESL
jgi:hypothetical protein